MFSFPNGHFRNEDFWFAVPLLIFYLYSRRICKASQEGSYLRFSSKLTAFSKLNLILSSSGISKEGMAIFKNPFCSGGFNWEKIFEIVFERLFYEFRHSGHALSIFEFWFLRFQGLFPIPSAAYQSSLSLSTKTAPP